MSLLSPLEQGLVGGLVRLRVVGVPPTLRLDGDRQELLRAALTASDRARPRHDLGVASIPPGLTQTHPSWLRRRLAQESPHVAAALARTLTEAGIEGLQAADWAQAQPARVPAPLLRQLMWVLLGPLCDPEPAALHAAPGHAREAGEAAHGVARAVLWQRMSGAVLWRALCERGAGEVGRSLHGAEPVMCARAMATVGAPWAQIIARFAGEPVEPPARDRARLAIARATAMAARERIGQDDSGRPAAETRLAFVGLSASMQEIGAAGPAAVRTIALRLPASVGRWLLDGEKH